MPEYVAPLSGLVQGLQAGQEAYQRKHQQIVDDVLTRYGIERQARQDVAATQHEAERIREWGVTERNKEQSTEATQTLKEAMLQFNMEKANSAQNYRYDSLNSRNFYKEAGLSAKSADNFMNWSQKMVDNASAAGVPLDPATLAPMWNAIHGSGNAVNPNIQLPSFPSIGAELKKSQIESTRSMTKEHEQQVKASEQHIRESQDRMRKADAMFPVQLKNLNSMVEYRSSMLAEKHRMDTSEISHRKFEEGVRSAELSLKRQEFKLKQSPTGIQRQKVLAEISRTIESQVSAAAKGKTEADKELDKLHADRAQVKAYSDITDHDIAALSQGDQTKARLRRQMARERLTTIDDDLKRTEAIRNGYDRDYKRARAISATSFEVTKPTGKPDVKETDHNRTVTQKQATSAEKASARDRRSPPKYLPSFAPLPGNVKPKKGDRVISLDDFLAGKH